MNMQWYEITKQFVIDAFTTAEKPTDVFHAERTAYWITQLKPNADEALLIAGVAHDIERAFHGDWKKGSSDSEALRKHQDMSADIAGECLKKQGAPDELIEQVCYLIKSHEEGGDADQNILCDADCVAYFEEKAVRNAKEHKQKGSGEEMKKKLEYVFARISSEQARSIARPYLKEALEILDAK